VKLLVRQTPHKGRGVFAGEFIPHGKLIVASPVIIVPRPQTAAVRGTILGDYVFDWPRNRCAVLLGEGSLINHSKFPNARWTVCEKTATIAFYANGPIAKGAEITHDYRWDANKTCRWT